MGDFDSSQPPPLSEETGCNINSGALPSANAAINTLAAAIPIQAVEPSPVPFEFTGTHREFFRIWIVNTFLTLVTFGIYAAWGKVRNKRYIFGKTKLLGHSFDFTAEPKSLLAGNALVLLLFLGYAFFGKVYWQVQIGTVAVAAFIVPWIIVRALAFNARNTVHRGLRFHYRGRYGTAFLVYVCMPVGCILSLGILYPFFAFQKKRLALNFLRFGDCTFKFTGRVGRFYRIYLNASLWLLIPCCTFAAIGIYSAATDQIYPIREPLLQYGLSAFFFVFGTIAKVEVQARRFTYVWNHTTAGAHRFLAEMSASQLLKIKALNALAIIGSLGLAVPWARLRTTRYTLSCLTILPASTLDTINHVGSSHGTALGDSASDFFGVDIGL
jgi:uncharacterized membrane protein YjgN (DUF898 family)